MRLHGGGELPHTIYGVVIYVGRLRGDARLNKCGVFDRIRKLRDQGHEGGRGADGCAQKGRNGTRGCGVADNDNSAEYSLIEKEKRWYPGDLSYEAVKDSGVPDMETGLVQACHGRTPLLLFSLSSLLISPRLLAF